MVSLDSSKLLEPVDSLALDVKQLSAAEGPADGLQLLPGCHKCGHHNLSFLAGPALGLRVSLSFSPANEPLQLSTGLLLYAMNSLRWEQRQQRHIRIRKIGALPMQFPEHRVAFGNINLLRTLGSAECRLALPSTSQPKERLLLGPLHNNKITPRFTLTLLNRRAKLQDVSLGGPPVQSNPDWLQQASPARFLEEVVQGGLGSGPADLMDAEGHALVQQPQLLRSQRLMDGVHHPKDLIEQRPGLIHIGCST